LKNITTISGESYGPSSATDYSPSFTELAEAFDRDPEKEKAKKTRKELLWKEEYLDDNRISSYIEWGYIVVDEEGKVSLTDSGKKAYSKNRKLKKKLEEGSEDDED